MFWFYIIQNQVSHKRPPIFATEFLRRVATTHVNYKRTGYWKKKAPKFEVANREADFKRGIATPELFNHQENLLSKLLRYFCLFCWERQGQGRTRQSEANPHFDHHNLLFLFCLKPTLSVTCHFILPFLYLPSLCSSWCMARNG